MKSLLLLLLASPVFAASPAEIAIRQASANIAKQPAHYTYYNDLAAAYVRRARETADVRWYQQAEAAVRESLALLPDNFDALKAKASMQLGRHQFAEALATATPLNRLAPDDLAIYGVLVDANIELGRDDDAIAAAQWMLNLREGAGPGLVKAAQLRELHGNLSGALDLLHKAFDTVSPADTDEQASTLARMAHIELLLGDREQAAKYANAALDAFPDFDAALAELAKVRLAERKFADAAGIEQRRYHTVPRAAVLYALAEAQAFAGRQEDSARSFAEFEKRALADGDADRELILYYADHASAPAKALEIARRSLTTRGDVFTLDAYAWALAANSEYDAAETEIHKALALGVKEPAILRHAESIAQRRQSQ